MTTIGKTVSLRGELRCDEDLTLEGRIEGPIFCEAGSVILGADAQVTGDVFARDITVFGRIVGRLIATDVVDVRPSARIDGQVLSKRFILHESAHFQGHVEPQHLEAALRVARFEQRKRDERLPPGRLQQGN